MTIQKITKFEKFIIKGAYENYKKTTHILAPQKILVT
jgi:hypothetical protein